ncbi:MAG: P-loop NTPase [Verrucomicrobiota bacterium]
MKRLILIMNGKGGVGKSTVANNLVQYFKDNGVAHRAVDTDDENSTLTRFHPEADFADITNTRGLDLLFEKLRKTDVVVVDCRAASTDLILGYLEEVDAFDVLRSLEASLTVVMPVNHELDSIEQLRVISSTLGNRCAYIVVRNQVHSQEFMVYDQSQTRHRLLKELQCGEIVLPKLHDWLVVSLSTLGVSVTTAISGSEFSLLDRQRLKTWQRKLYEQLDAARVFLIPSGTHAEVSASPSDSERASEVALIQ